MTKAKPFSGKPNLFDNSRMQTEEQWGNIPVGDLTDEELHSKQWWRTGSRTETARQNLRDGVKTREQNGWYDKVIANRIQDQKTDEQYIEAHRKGLDRRSQNEDWRKNVTTAAVDNLKIAQERKQAKYTKLKKEDPEEYARLMKQQRAHKKKRVITPDGVFDSRLECAKYYGHGPSWVLSQIKKRADWSYEE